MQINRTFKVVKNGHWAVFSFQSYAQPYEHQKYYKMVE